MEKQVCIICLKPKAVLECGICKEPICKGCTQFVEQDHFSFYSRLPENLNHSTFCGTCFFEKIQPALDTYANLMEQARQVSVFFKDQGKETRLMSRIEKPVRVKDCLDKDEAVLRLAFHAVEREMNTLIDVDLVSVKVKDGKYQHLIWSGSGIPVDLDSEKLKRK